MTKATTTTTSEASTTTAPKAKPGPPTFLGDANEAVLADLKALFKVPGTELGLLARGIETDLRSTQDRLNARGSIETVEGILGRQVKVGLNVRVQTTVVLSAYDDEEVPSAVARFILVPNPAKDPSPPAPASGASLAEGIKVSNDIGPENDPTATP